MRKLLMIAALGLAAACSVGAQTSGGGAQGQRSFEVGPFQSVSLEGSHDVIVTVGGAPSVRAEGDQEMLDRLDIRVENGALKIGTERGNWSWFGHNGRVTVHVSVPALESASIAGSGDLRIDRVESQRFAASIAGSGDIEIAALRAGQARFSISGSGGIRAVGTAEAAEISIAGSGDVALGGLQARRARVSVAGSGNVTLHASESVEGSLMGSGDLVVRGGARCTVSKMGSGDIRCGG